MNISKTYIDIFKSNDKKTAKFFEYADSTDFDIKKDSLFIKAVNLAYLDAARTFKGIKDKDEVLEKLAKEIQKYFKENKTSDFDTLHYTLCDKFIKNLRARGYTPSYGQAQKVVNMTFKYLYCCEGAERYKNKFFNCHMALDSYTLNWFKYDVLKCWYNEQTDKSRYPTIHYGKINNDVKWSNLIQGDVTEAYSYLWIQKIVREYFENYLSYPYKTKDGESLTPFEAEFYIWPEQQWKEASKKLLGLKESMIALASQSEPETFDKIFNMINEINSKLKF